MRLFGGGGGRKKLRVDPWANSGASLIDKLMKERPEYKALLDRDGSLLDKYVMFDENNPYRQESIKLVNDLRDDAYSKDPTALANLLLEYQANQAVGARDNLNQQSQSQLQSNLNNVMMRGGVDSGDRLRFMSNANRDLVNQRQGLERNLEGQRINILGEDNQYKQGLKDKVINWNNLRQQYDDNLRLGDINREMGEYHKKFDGDLSAWNSKMQAHGAKESANAMRNTKQKSGGLISSVFKSIF